MRWEDERYVRLYTRDTPEEVALGWEALALWRELLRKFDRAGLLELGKTGTRGLAGLTRMPIEVVDRAMALLLEDGRVRLEGTTLVCPNYIVANETPQSDKLRQKEKRERDRQRAMSGTKEPDESRNVTAPSQNVTESHELSRAVTPSHAPSLRAVPCRAVPDPSGGGGEPPPAPKDKPVKRKPDAKPDTLPGITLEPRGESPEQIGWRTWRAAYPTRYKRPHRKQDGDGLAMRRLVALAGETVREMGRQEPDALECLLKHTWARFLADPGGLRQGDRDGYLERTGHRLRDCNAGLNTYGTPWDRAAQRQASPPAIEPPARELRRLEPSANGAATGKAVAELMLRGRPAADPGRPT